MKKSKIWLLLSGGLVILVTIVSFVSIDRVTIQAAQAAYVDQEWKVGFSSPLNEEALQSQHLYIADKNNHKFEARFQLDKAGKVLSVTGLQPGTYTMHIKRDAIKGKKVKLLSDKQVKVQVYETLTAIQSAKEIEDYFQSIRQQLTFQGSKQEMAEDKASNYSTTNNQVEGIEEADTVLTDGDYIFSVADGERLLITDIRNPKQMKQAAEVKFENGEYPSQLLLHDNLLIVIGNQSDMGLQTEQTANILLPYHNFSTIKLYDIENRETPTLLREYGMEGSIVGVRKNAQTLYVVTTVFPMIWDVKAIDGENARPRVSDSEMQDGELTYVPFEDLSILPNATSPSYTVISSIDLENYEKSELTTKGFLGSSEQLYMSENHLYLTTTAFEQAASSGPVVDMWAPHDVSTQFFKFALQDSSITFHSSATLDGMILNQFSMDEYNNHFRVAMTEGNMWDEKNPSSNHLYMLNSDMKVVGSVENLAKGERIYSARFMGDKAYIVTFRETDPLFVFDVSDPTAPRVLGELKIPGFSNYLHPLNENYLIGFGYDTVAEKNPHGSEPIIRRQGMKISLFDVTNSAEPKEVDAVIIGGEGTYSPVDYEHKALFRHPEKQLFGFPIQMYTNNRNGSLNYKGAGALVYEITEQGITLKGDFVQLAKQGEQYEEWGNEVQRLIYSGDTLFTVSRNQLTSYSISDFSKIGAFATN